MYSSHLGACTAITHLCPSSTQVNQDQIWPQHAPAQGPLEEMRAIALQVIYSRTNEAGLCRWAEAILGRIDGKVSLLRRSLLVGKYSLPHLAVAGQAWSRFFLSIHFSSIPPLFYLSLSPIHSPSPSCGFTLADTFFEYSRICFLALLYDTCLEQTISLHHHRCRRNQHRIVHMRRHDTSWSTVRTFPLQPPSPLLQPVHSPQHLTTQNREGGKVAIVLGPSEPQGICVEINVLR